MPTVKGDSRSSVAKVSEISARSTKGFEDAMQVAHMERQGIAELLNYDRDFDRVATVTQLEPCVDRHSTPHLPGGQQAY